MGQKAYSIKTRIKTLVEKHECALVGAVRKHILLKQGLRQTKSVAISDYLAGQKAYSIKTRIKTSSESK